VEKERLETQIERNGTLNTKTIYENQEQIKLEIKATNKVVPVLN
jgi:hypothetical protein